MPALPSFQLDNIELIEGKIVKRRLFTFSSAACYATYIAKKYMFLDPLVFI